MLYFLRVGSIRISNTLTFSPLCYNWLEMSVPEDDKGLFYMFIAVLIVIQEKKKEGRG